jgi:hypothetical protein
MWMKFAVPNRSVSFRIVNIAGTFGHGILVLNERSEHQRAFGYGGDLGALGARAWG